MSQDNEKFDCCKVDGNLKVIESTMLKTVYKCAVCDRRHFEFTAFPENMLVKPQ